MWSCIGGAGAAAGGSGHRGSWWPVGSRLCLALALAGIVLAAPSPSRAAAGTAAPDLEDRVREVASELRCVVCQNLSVADSPSDLAKEMRNLVRELLEQGKTREEIQAYFVSRYGEFVLLAPPKRGFNLLVWGLPFVALAVGACAIYFVAKRWTVQGEQPGPSVNQAYAERVRRELREREHTPGS